MSNKTIDVIFNFLITIQMVMLFLFLVENISDLDVVVFDFNEAGYDSSFEVSFYDLIAVVGALFLLAVVSGLNILGTGLNEESTKTFQKFCGFVSLFILLSIGINYYLSYLFPINLYLDVFIIVVYVIKSFDNLGGNLE